MRKHQTCGFWLLTFVQALKAETEGSLPSAALSDSQANWQDSRSQKQFPRVMASFEVHFSWSQEQADFQANWASFTEVFEEENGFHL